MGDSSLPDAGLPFQYFVIDGSTIIGLLEQPLGGGDGMYIELFTFKKSLNIAFICKCICCFKTDLCICYKVMLSDTILTCIHILDLHPSQWAFQVLASAMVEHNISLIQVSSDLYMFAPFW